MSTPEKLYKKHNHWAFSPDNYSENDDIYILKSTADKAEQFQTAVAYSCGHDYAIERSSEQLEKILKPIREFQNKYDGVVLTDYYKAVAKFDEAVHAIKETLELADKAGK